MSIRSEKMFDRPRDTLSSNPAQSIPPVAQVNGEFSSHKEISGTKPYPDVTRTICVVHGVPSARPPYRGIDPGCPTPGVKR